MLYDYTSKELVQDVVLKDIETIVDDIVEEFYRFHRYDELSIYVPSSIAREILSELLEIVEEVWVHADSENELLYSDNEVLITIAYDGMIFVEEARGEDGQLKSNEDNSLTYVYDGFSKKDIDVLDENAESILIFGFNEDDECTCGKCECTCRESEKKSVGTTSATYKVNGKSVSKEEFDNKCAEFEETYMDNIRDMMLRYCDLMDAFNDWQKMF